MWSVQVPNLGRASSTYGLNSSFVMEGDADVVSGRIYKIVVIEMRGFIQ